MSDAGATRTAFLRNLLKLGPFFFLEAVAGLSFRGTTRSRTTVGARGATQFAYALSSSLSRAPDSAKASNCLASSAFDGFVAAAALRFWLRRLVDDLGLLVGQLRRERRFRVDVAAIIIRDGVF